MLNNCKNNEIKHVEDCNYPCNDVYEECNKYKEKSDELYLKATYIQEESKRIICEARELEAHAKELEYQAKQLCAKANVAWSKAQKLDAESDNMLDLASFYCQKATECFKNASNSSIYHKPNCNMNFGSCCK